MALEKEMWLADIQENLFKNNVIINRAISHDEWIKNKTVHIPQAGSNPTVTKNLLVFPAVAVQRTDTDLTYNVDTYYLQPILIEKGQEEQFISYNKRMSVLDQQIKTLEQSITNHAIYKWAPVLAGSILRTTGAVTGNALAPSATGTRKAITLADIAALKAQLDAQEVPQEGRILLIPSSMYNAQLLAITDVYSMQVYGTANLPSGVVNKIHGFDIVIRSTVAVYTNAATPVLKVVNDEGTPSAPAATDNLAALAYHPSFVARAIGITDVNINENSPGYYGSSIIESFKCFGAAKLRTTEVGIVALVQIP